MTTENIIGQREDRDLPRYAGTATFALLPRLEEVDHADVAVVAPAYDHAGITGLAAAHTARELRTLMGLGGAVVASRAGA